MHGGKHHDSSGFLQQTPFQRLGIGKLETGAWAGQAAGVLPQVTQLLGRAGVNPASGLRLFQAPTATTLGVPQPTCGLLELQESLSGLVRKPVLLHGLGHR